MGIEDKKRKREREKERKRERERGVLNLGAYVGRAATARLAELFFRSSSLLFSSFLFSSPLFSSASCSSTTRLFKYSSFIIDPDLLTLGLHVAKPHRPALIVSYPPTMSMHACTQAHKHDAQKKRTRRTLLLGHRLLQLTLQGSSKATRAPLERRHASFLATRVAEILELRAS